MEMVAELDFTIDWARSASAKARSKVEVMPGGGAVVEGSGFRVGSPVGVCSLSVVSSSWWTRSGSGFGSQSWIGESRGSTISSMEVDVRSRIGGCLSRT